MVKDNSYILQCVKTGEMLNEIQMVNIYHLLNQILILEVDGDILEAGTFRGWTAALIQIVLMQNYSDKTLHVYDSFQGLSDPAMDDHGTYLKRGDCASTESEFKATFQEFNLELPVIHKGWIDDIFPAELPEKISFAHLDIDLYEPTLKALTCIYPRLADRAIVVIDDYYHSAIHSNMCRIAGANNSRLAIGELCPGVKGACDDFFADKPEIIEVMFSGDKTHCFFRKLGK